MRNIRLTLEYDGTAYHGWQSQTNASTVQGTVTAAVNSLTGESCSLIGSSRTDKGVHALGYVCNFLTGSAIPSDKFSFALNTLLPDDIVVKKSEEVPYGFHSRFDAAGKTYRYLIYNSAFPSALLRYRAYHVYYPLDIDAMNSAAQHLTGTHDFFAFSAAGGSVKTTIRTISRAGIHMAGEPFENDIIAGCPRKSTNGDFDADPCACGTNSHKDNSGSGRLIEFTITGNGFLYNMVRIIAGTLIEVGFGKLKPDDIPAILESRDRRKAGRTAPAHGLYLVEVYYGGAAALQKNEMADDY